jgi:predicted esterase
MSRSTLDTLDFVHRFVPASNPGEAATLLLLHGTGGNENDLIPLGQRLMPEANLLSPRGKVREQGRPRFFRRLAEGVFDQEDLKFRTEELADFIQAAIEEYRLDPGKILAVGYSNGANIAASLLLSQPGRLAGAVLFHPMVPFVPEILPNLQGRPIFIGAGRNDPIVPVQNTTQLASLLQDGGAEITLHWHKGGLTLTPDEIEGARLWLQAWKPSPAS